METAVDEYSDEHAMSCGVRQGELTSTRLFNLYVNQLIARCSMNVGCRIDGVPSLNNISYADDMVLLSLSLGGLRRKLRECETCVSVW